MRGGVFINIAICDDEDYENKKICKLINGYSEKKGIVFTCEAFTSGGELLRKKCIYDVYILDYCMDDMNGLEVARELRKKGVNSLIIFLTSHCEIVYETFKLYAYRFLLKPINESDLYEALDELSKSSVLHERIAMKKEKGIDIVWVRDILYIEANKKNSVVCLENSVSTYPRLISELENELPRELFFRCHRSYVINMMYVVDCDDKQVTMKNGEKIPISRRSLTSFNRARMDFVHSKILFSIGR